MSAIVVHAMRGPVFAIHYENLPVHIQRFFSVVKTENFKSKIFDIFLIFAQNIDCGLTSTHNLCFGGKIRKISNPLYTTVLLYTHTYY